MKMLLCFVLTLVSFPLYGQADYTTLLLLQSTASASTPNTNFFFWEDFDAHTNPWTPILGTGINLRFTVNPIQGSYSGSVSNDTFVYTYATFSAKDVVYGKFRFRVDSEPTGDGARFTLSRVGVDDDMIIQFRYTLGHVKVWHGNSASASSVGGTLPTDLGVNYYCWFKWQKGTGANGVLDVYLSATDSRPETPDCSIANGVSTSQPTALSLQAQSSGSLVIDEIQLSETGFPTP